MPTTPTSPNPARADLPLLSRRQLLAAMGSTTLLGAAVLAGCKPSGDANSGSTATNGTTPGPTSNGTGSKRDAVIKRAADNERTLIAAYDDAIAGYPDLAARLTPLRADHLHHLDALLPGAAATLSATPTPTTTSTTTPTPTPSPTLTSTLTSSAPPALATPEPTVALSELSAKEHAAAAARVDDVAASSGSLARLLASIGGCEAAHEALLRAPA